MLNSYIDFIHNFAIDETLIWQLQIDEQTSIEITYSRIQKPLPWTVKCTLTDRSKRYDSRDIETAMKEWNIDDGLWIPKLKKTILYQAVFADMVLKSARQICGENNVDHYISETENYLTAISEAIVGSPPKAPVPEKAQLSIVKS